MRSKRYAGLTDIENALVRRTGLTASEVRFFLDHFFDVLLEFLFECKSVHLVGFGKFYLKMYRARKKKHKSNPMMPGNSDVVMPAHYRVVFREGKKLKAALKEVLRDWAGIIEA